MATTMANSRVAIVARMAMAVALAPEGAPEEPDEVLQRYLLLR